MPFAFLFVTDFQKEEVLHFAKGIFFLSMYPTQTLREGGGGKGAIMPGPRVTGGPQFLPKKKKKKNIYFSF